MRNLAHEAGFIALDELKIVERVGLLMPRGWGAIAFDMGTWPDGIDPMFSHMSSKYTDKEFQSLVIVGSGHRHYGVGVALKCLADSTSEGRVWCVEDKMLFIGNECYTHAVYKHIRFEE